MVNDNGFFDEQISAIKSEPENVSAEQQKPKAEKSARRTDEELMQKYLKLKEGHERRLKNATNEYNRAKRKVMDKRNKEWLESIYNCLQVNELMDDEGNLTKDKNGDVKLNVDIRVVVEVGLKALKIAGQ